MRMRISSELTAKLSEVGGGLGDGWDEAPIVPPVSSNVAQCFYPPVAG